MDLINLIQQHAEDDAAAGKWDAVVGVLNAPVTVPDSRLVGSAEILQTLGFVDGEAVLAAFAASQIGKLGLAKLAATGLDFSHPLTIGMVQQLEAAKALPVGAAAKLLSLGQRQTSLAIADGLGVVTAEQCETAWNDHLNQIRIEESERTIEPLRQQFDAAMNAIRSGAAAEAKSLLQSLTDSVKE